MTPKEKLLELKHAAAELQERAITTDSLSIAFGDFQRAYTVVRKVGVKLLSDPYTDKPNVRLYGYQRVGGGISNSEAIKFLKFGDS